MLVLAAEYFCVANCPVCRACCAICPCVCQLEDYVFYATLYGRSPELIEGDIFSVAIKNFPSSPRPHLPEIMRQAVINHLSG